MKIESTANPRIKALAELKERKGRQKQGQFLIEGAREIERALQGGIALHQALYTPQLSEEENQVLQQLWQRGLDTLEVAPAPLAKLSVRENPAGLIAVASPPQGKLSQLALPSPALVLVCVGVEKPGNLGAILRSADAAGAHAVLAVGGLELWHPQVIRNSTGVVFTLPTFGITEEHALEWLRQSGLALVASSPGASLSYWQANLRESVALAVGPEHQGLPEKWLKRATQQVRIPMRGHADSLNVSVSAALLLYEALRQRS